MDDPMAREEARSLEGGRKKSGGGSQPSGADEEKTGGSLFQKPALDEMGRDVATPAGPSLFRKNSLDEMTVGRTEKPVAGSMPARPDETVASKKRFSPLLEGQPDRAAGSDDAKPVQRGKIGAGSYEDPGEAKRKGRTKGKTGRPGR
jgi:excinuclease ABC subunit B